MNAAVLDDAYPLLDAALMYYQNRPVGTAAAIDDGELAAENYRECFIRDFAVSGLVFLRLIENRWDDLVGTMPVKLCYPALSGEAWRRLTGSDPKNAPWSYHNGGNWPVLLWPLVAAALKRGRPDLAERACTLAVERLPRDVWPEYYDGRGGRLIGRHANLDQTWSAAALILAHKLIEDPSLLDLLPN